MSKLLLVAMLLLAAAAVAQQSAPPAEDLQPGVDTSAPSQAPASTPPAAAKPAPAASPATANKPAAKPAQKSAQSGNAKDRLDLDSTQITGNRELPKVLYIVPWRSAELGDLVCRPVLNKLDAELKPVERDDFRMQNHYFE